MTTATVAGAVASQAAMVVAAGTGAVDPGSNLEYSAGATQLSGDGQVRQFALPGGYNVSTDA